VAIRDQDDFVVLSETSLGGITLQKHHRMNFWCCFLSQVCFRVGLGWYKQNNDKICHVKKSKELNRQLRIFDFRLLLFAVCCLLKMLF
jgi:hypothetical protein